jgi:hypothetical protein
MPMANWVEKYHEQIDFLTEGVSMGCKVLSSSVLKPSEVAFLPAEVVIDIDGNMLYTTLVPRKEEHG